MDYFLMARQEVTLYLVLQPLYGRTPLTIRTSVITFPLVLLLFFFLHVLLIFLEDVIFEINYQCERQTNIKPT